jgi:hypothetical protein
MPHAVGNRRRFPGWDIIEGSGGGYIAVRVVPVSKSSGLSNVRCGADLPELYKHLAEETRLEKRNRKAGRGG